MLKFPLSPKLDLIIVEIAIKGKGAKNKPVFLTMAIDTGTSFTSIPFDAAKSIGCRPKKARRKLEIITASDTKIVYAPLVTVPHFQIWGKHLRNIDVICIDLPPKRPISGLIGLNVLRHFNIGLNFLKKKLEIKLQ
jgi:predicted aspartyl protease